ncbi:hypothetical protein G4B88_006716 [Cannabis sativa]|uniref:Uncharacterized protein n=1 Tax=Cannabis sativa TaxID=3483 RepID=A0A7J6GVQ5_CANSA|nr:hypothetical protein G4B88_006716 [Cannabis sativa]
MEDALRESKPYTDRLFSRARRVWSWILSWVLCGPRRRTRVAKMTALVILPCKLTAAFENPQLKSIGQSIWPNHLVISSTRLRVKQQDMLHSEQLLVQSAQISNLVLLPRRKDSLSVTLFKHPVIAKTKRLSPTDTSLNYDVTADNNNVFIFHE